MVNVPETMPYVPDLIPRLTQLNFLVSEIGRWNRGLNLVADPTPNVAWRRHVADSAQLLKIVPNATRWLDIGTGAGFPGIVIAILISSRLGARVHCVESDHRKCAFLRHVARETGAPASSHCTRPQAFPRGTARSFDAITAWAFSSLAELVRMSEFWIERGATGIFPQGSRIDFANETPEIRERFEFGALPRTTNPSSTIVTIRARAQ